LLKCLNISQHEPACVFAKNLKVSKAPFFRILSLYFFRVVTPAHATDQFFVRTKLIKAVSQNKTICADEPSFLRPKYASGDDCEFLKLVDYSDRYANGTCDMARGTCYMNAWCPVDTEPYPR